MPSELLAFLAGASDPLATAALQSFIVVVLLVVVEACLRGRDGWRRRGDE